jgi:hypothetical protein
VKAMTVQTLLHTTNTELWPSASTIAIQSLHTFQKTNVWQIAQMDGLRTHSLVSRQSSAIQPADRAIPKMMLHFAKRVLRRCLHCHTINSMEAMLPVPVQ